MPTVNAKKTKPEQLPVEHYVSRGGLKISSIAEKFDLKLAGKIVLDVGSSTGGFTDFALRHFASQVIAVDAGTDQMHPSLRTDPRIELHERTDIRSIEVLSKRVHYVFIDVSFISIREVLTHLPDLIDSKTEIIAMVKPQFEVSSNRLKHKGIIKNETIRRQVLKDFEHWVLVRYRIIAKADSLVAGDKGNRERFYRLVLLGD